MDQALGDNLPEVDIIDLLIKTIDWTEIEKLFGPLSGHQRKVKDYKKRLVASLICMNKICSLNIISDIQPDKVQGDTHAQSTIVFGLAHLLGIKLMPRISNINSLLFFKPDRRIRYKHIDELFSEGINYQLIRDN